MSGLHDVRIARLSAAVALAAPITASPALPIVQALAQASAQEEIDELVRKAEAEESEDGYCERLAWPPGPTLEQFTKWLQGAREGTWKVNLFANGNCQYDRVTRIHREKGGKCVTYTYYGCVKGGTCGINQSVDCRNGKGVFVTRK